MVITRVVLHPADHREDWVIVLIRGVGKDLRIQRHKGMERRDQIDKKSLTVRKIKFLRQGMRMLPVSCKGAVKQPRIGAVASIQIPPLSQLR